MSCSAPRSSLLIAEGVRLKLISEVLGHSTSPHRRYFGAVIGTVEIVDCVRNSRLRWAAPGMWQWILADPLALRSPVPIRGRLGLWVFPDGQLPLRTSTSGSIRCTPGYALKGA